MYYYNIIHVCVCVCVWGGGSVLFSTILQLAPPHGDPWAAVTCNSWLKLTADHPSLLGKLAFEHRVPFDGITQFLTGVFICRGFAHLSECEIFSCT